MGACVGVCVPACVRVRVGGNQGCCGLSHNNPGTSLPADTLVLCRAHRCRCPPHTHTHRTPCHVDKKHNKKSPSFSCVEAGLALAVGKHGPIEFEPATGATMERMPDASGSLQLVKTASRGLEGDVMPDEDEN